MLRTCSVLCQNVYAAPMGSSGWPQIGFSGPQYKAVTVKGGQYEIPLTNTSVAKTIVWKYGIYGLFFAFIFISSHYVEAANGGNMMGSAFIWVIIVFNIVVLLMALFLARSL